MSSERQKQGMRKWLVEYVERSNKDAILIVERAYKHNVISDQLLMANALVYRSEYEKSQAVVENGN